MGRNRLRKAVFQGGHVSTAVGKGNTLCPEGLRGCSGPGIENRLNDIKCVIYSPHENAVLRLEDDPLASLARGRNRKTTNTAHVLFLPPPTTTQSGTGIGYDF